MLPSVIGRWIMGGKLVTFRSLVNTRGLRHESARALHEALFMPVLMVLIH